MHLYDSLLIASQSYKNSRQRIIFTCQIFYSGTLEFSENDSIICSESIFPGDTITFKFSLKNSPKFIRIDPGYFYSIHQNVKVDVIRINENQEEETIDCNPAENSLFCHNIYIDFSEKGLLMVCGSDPHYVFENKFLDDNIFIIFKSNFLLGISEK